MKRRRASGCPAGSDEKLPCIPRTGKQKASASDASDAERLKEVLAEQGVHLPKKRLDHLAFHINRSVRIREATHRRRAKARLPQDDILRLIMDARDKGDRDEAVWRSFLAAHFGRESADPNDQRQVMSASRLMNAFGPKQIWTWASVSSRPKDFRKWLNAHRDELRTLHYGNHRKMEAKKPELIWEVIESFIELAAKHHDSPMAALVDGIDASVTSHVQFELLYRRLKRSLWRFGRTGVFDFLILLEEIKLIDATPGYCYLKGSTGPRVGARLVWGKRPIKVLEQLAADLAERLEVPAAAMEDALCNWQKSAP